jgi:hypothetical protein
MAGAILERELTAVRTGRLEFDLARQQDDAELRRLLRENPMPGRISLSLEREPNYFTDADLWVDGKQTIVAREGERVVCAGCCTTRTCFVNGEGLRVGYLGGLRLDRRQAGRFDVLRRGYEFFRELQTSAPADFYFTSIASDNERARQLLERGIRGMPLYEFAGEFVTVIIPTAHCEAASPLTSETETSPFHSEDELLALVNGHNCGYQFAPCWSASELTALRPLGLQSSDFCIEHDDGKLAACAAIWDQRKFKQTVIRGYAPWLAFVRPAFNLWARVANQPQLPGIGETLRNAFVSHLACRNDEPGVLLSLINKLRRTANQRGIQLLTLGFDANDPRLTIIRGNLRLRAYRSRIYVVRWPGIGGTARHLHRQLLAPEVALL